jgi:hypothetical protein
MKTGRLIVNEKRGRWSAALRREPALADVHVHETRALNHCWRELAAWPASFLVWEATLENTQELIDGIMRLVREYPQTAAVAVAERPCRVLEWVVREAGAIHFVASPRQLVELARMAQRHLAVAPPAELSPLEGIWAELPWTDFFGDHHHVR